MNSALALDLRTVHRPPAGRRAQPVAEASDEAPARDIHALPEGFRLFDYEIVGTIGENGNGIVYLAWDHVLEQHVAVREYLPGVLASRDRVSAAVVAKSKGRVAAFQAGLCSFVNQARMLARFDHPSLPRVLHFWEGNGTAYMAMPYYEGATLARALVELGRPPDEAQLCSWLRPLLDALGTVHASACVHGGIATHRILLTDEGPVLTAFGGMRDVGDDIDAPLSDLRALAGVVYAAIAGQPPARRNDRVQPLAEVARRRYSGHFMDAIDAALSPIPQGGGTRAAELWNRLSGAHDRREQDPDRPAFVFEAPFGHEAPALAARALAPRRSRGQAAARLALGLLVGLGAAAAIRLGDPGLPPSPPEPVQRVSLPAAPAPATEPVTVPPQAEAQASAPVPVPVAVPVPVPVPVPPAPALASTEPLPREAAPEPVAPEPARRTVQRARPEPARARGTAASAPAPAPLATAQVAPGRSPCVESLQRASLGPLTAREAALLRKDCEP
ncbi:protein kinase [Variovorax sp. J22P271]|uniref:serine/threonine protein kinase n=1 Tax=Variovorax davisae TaxID=3053515 RepID=UPI002575E727|nr:protein kinase [Variovorax sp. J22P271]MDM0034562.1 protein kinase [Variovorax sp. J22P271]